jgi:deoxyribonuclease V
MTQPALPDWDGDVAAARALQESLAREVALENDFPTPLRRIAGFDVGFEDEGAITRAAAVLLDADSLQPLRQAVARIPTRMPYLPGLLSFRELPA